MVSAPRKAKQLAEFKHVVEDILQREFLDIYLKSIGIDTVGNLVVAKAIELEQASRPSATAGAPDIMISLRDIDEIIAFQHYLKFNKRHIDPSRIIKDFSTITEESFIDFKMDDVFDYTTRSFTARGN
jgi:hypothetical protein